MPGLFSCLCLALEADSPGTGSYLGDVAPLGWLALNTALLVPDARQNALLPRMAAALSPWGGAAAKAAAQLQLLLAPAQPAATGAGEKQADGAPAVVAVEDLLHCAGGRHDNDKEDFRSVKVLVTSEEVSVGALILQPEELAIKPPRLRLSHCHVAV